MSDTDIRNIFIHIKMTKMTNDKLQINIHYDYATS